MPFLCHSLHILTTGLPRGSSADSFMALFWVTTAKEFSISQNLIGEKKPNTRLGSHPAYLLSHDVIELPFRQYGDSLPLFLSLPSLPPGGKPPYPKLGGSASAFQFNVMKHVMYSWLEVLGSEFMTQQTVNPRGYVTEYSWTRYNLEKADKAKSKRHMCLL